ncbi:hypothetical protein MSKU15_0675 [Komagataeibacter diospyri]|nr:hypothetical protein MSKU15_0675 [Komagataeibacter diospyri]
MASLFSGKVAPEATLSSAYVEKLHVKTARLLVERDFCAMPLFGWARSDTAKDRPETASAFGRAAIHVAATPPIGRLLSAGARERGQSGTYAPERRAVPGDIVLRVPSDEPASSSSWPLAGSPDHGKNGAAGGLSETARDCATSRASGISVCTAGSGRRPAQPSVVFRYHLYPDAQGRFLSVGAQGRARARCAVLASGIKHMRRPLK